MDTPDHGHPTLQSELLRILSSRSFDGSGQSRRFLSFIVDETVAGRGERIKAYTIALEVLGRPPEFDPLLDPIVRIKAMRLRRSLDRFYLLEGPNRGLRLQIPKGRYIPLLVPVTIAEHAGESGTPRLQIQPLVFEGTSEDVRRFSESFVHDLIVDLSRFPSLAVYGHCPNTELRVDYVLKGKITERASQLVAGLHLERASDQRILWADRFEVPRGDGGIGSDTDISAGVARTLAQAYGVIFSDRADDADSATSDAPSSFAAVRSFLDYWRSLDNAGMDSSEAALLKVMAQEPQNADVRACLSLLHTNRARYRLIRELDAEAQLHRAMQLAAEAIDITPFGSWGYYALGLSYWFEGDVHGALSSLEHALTLNPNDMVLLAELGHRYAMRMEWERAVPMINAAYAASPALPASSLVGLFLYHFHHRQFEQARAVALKIRDLPIPHGALAMAAVSGEMGDAQRGREALEQLERIRPGYLAVVREDLTDRSLHPTLIEEIASGVAKLRERLAS